MQFTTASVVKSVIQFEKRDLSVLYFFPLSQKFVLKLYQTSRIIYSSECCPRNNLKFPKKRTENEKKRTLGTAAWKRKSVRVIPKGDEAVSVAMTRCGLSAGRSNAKSTRRPFFS